MFRYSYSGLLKKYSIPKNIVNYDKIVDYSSFRDDAQQVRDLINGAGSGTKGVYDDPKNMPDDTLVKLRSGKFDKAEVSQMIIAQKEKVDKSIEDGKKQSEAERLEKINQARQDYIDKKTGFTGQPTE